MRNAIFLITTAACATLAACDNQYIERKDSLTFGLGDAVSTNNAAQIPNPWPRHSQNTRIPMDGVKAQAAMARYRGVGGPIGPIGPGLGAPGPGGGAPPPQ